METFCHFGKYNPVLIALSLLIQFIKDLIESFTDPKFELIPTILDDVEQTPDRGNIWI